MAPGRRSTTSSEDSATSSKKMSPGVPIARHLVEQSLPLSLYNLDLNDNFFSDLGTGATEQSIRPRVVLREDIHKQPVGSLSGDETYSTLHVLRPRAVLSSPENDELLSQVQEQPKKVSTPHPPKAPLSPLNDVYGNTSGYSSQSSTEFSFTPVSKLDNFQAGKKADTPSTLSPGDPAAKCKNQAEMKGKASPLTSANRKEGLLLRKLPRQWENPHETVDKNQTQKKKVGVILAPKTNTKKEIHPTADSNSKSRKKAGCQGVRPWY